MIIIYNMLMFGYIQDVSDLILELVSIQDDCHLDIYIQDVTYVVVAVVVVLCLLLFFILRRIFTPKVFFLSLIPKLPSSSLLSTLDKNPAA